MNKLSASFWITALLLVSCEKREAAPSPSPTASYGLRGTYVSIQLARSTLGISRDKPLSPEADSYSGVNLSVSGYVQEETERFLVIGKHLEKEKNEGLQWIPYSSILSVSQPTDQDRQFGKTEERPEAWRFERIQSLMHLIGFDLTNLPEGTLDVWIDRKGQKEMLTTTETVPGQEQWLYIGIDPVTYNALVTTVIHKDTAAGSGIGFFHTEGLIPFKKTIESGHDWRKSSMIAIEHSGEGKIYAKLRDKE